MRFEPASRIAGALRPPPDKSISHRAALVAAMCEEPVRVVNFLRADDTASTAAAIRTLGAVAELGESGSAGADLAIRGVGLRGAGSSDGDIDVGNAGTLMRLLPGWLAGQGRGHWTLDGDKSIRRRPMDRIADPLRAMGASVECREGRFAPVVIDGRELHGADHELPIASAQVKSCLLLAGLLAKGSTTVAEPQRTRDHTEIMLRNAGARVEVEGERVAVAPVERLVLDEVAVPGDFSSAAFFVVAATLVAGSELAITDSGLNPTRTGLLDVMVRMGANIEREDAPHDGGEAVGDLTVRSAPLRATTVEPGEVPLLIDELPLVALLGAFADGTTVVRGAEELRQKESDRIATVTDGLRGLGASIEATSDGFEVEGIGALRGGTIDSRGDHRLAMLGAVAGAASQRGVEVRGFEAAAVSYPGFAADLELVT
ncbi:MAG: 3-phosphoshikimate 1-carboxyvinyltransferase [Solirubrobacterales bacterium]